jgi:hypothetical protein
MKEKGHPGRLVYAKINPSCFQKDFIDYCTLDSAIIYLLYQLNVEVLYFVEALDFFGALYFDC